MELKKQLVRLGEKIKAAVDYCTGGVWQAQQQTFKVRLVKTINLSVRSFLDRSLQMKSCALTYSTVLAIVPAFALLFSIARGFGFQKEISDELYAYFPAQHEAVEKAMSFVDSYLHAAGQGVFVGVGIVVLLWTLVSLLSTIEDVFNTIWDVRKSRTLYQKATDYIAICMIIPVLMVCSSGVSIFMSTIVQTKLDLPFLTPVINTLLECAPLVMVWLAFTLSFFLIPNTKVKFSYAAVSGAICGLAYMILQLLFVNGQIYVTKYNAIYGSFAFLPLLLVWLQLSWLILLAGCVLTYSMQNVFAYNFMGDVKGISIDYYRKVALVLMTAVVQRFLAHGQPYTRNDISTEFDLPIRLVSQLEDRLLNAGLLYKVVLPKQQEGIAPAFNCDTFSVKALYDALDSVGYVDFIPHFNKRYAKFVGLTDTWNSHCWDDLSAVYLKDLTLD